MQSPDSDNIKKGRVVRLFRNGCNQALRIPRDLEFDVDEALLRREGDRLIIEPVRRGGLLAALAGMEPLEIDFPDVDDSLGALDSIDL